MATTTNWGIVYPVVGNIMTPLATQFANLAQSTETALNSTGRMTGTDAQRIALTAPRLKAGLLWYSTDTKREWEYDGANWLINDCGMYLIYPTSITGGTVDASGTIIPTTGASSVVVDFGSLTRFRSLKIDLFFSPTAADSPIFRFRRSGTNLSTAASYRAQRLRSNVASVASDYTAENYAHIGVVGQAYTTVSINILNAGSSSSVKAWNISGFQGPQNPQSVTIGGIKDDSEAQAAIDGLSFSWLTSTFGPTTGQFIKIYGMV